MTLYINNLHNGTRRFILIIIDLPKRVSILNNPVYIVALKQKMHSGDDTKIKPKIQQHIV